MCPPECGQRTVVQASRRGRRRTLRRADGRGLRSGAIDYVAPGGRGEDPIDSEHHKGHQHEHCAEAKHPHHLARHILGHELRQNAKKKIVNFGLSRLTSTADVITRAADGGDCRAVTTRALLSRHVAQASTTGRRPRGTSPSRNATLLARSSAAVPVMAAARWARSRACSRTPQRTPALPPRARPAEIVYSAPVPGVTTMTKEVITNARLNNVPPVGNVRHSRMGGSPALAKCDRIMGSVSLSRLPNRRRITRRSFKPSLLLRDTSAIEAFRDTSP